MRPTSIGSKDAENGSFKATDDSTLLYALSEPQSLKNGKRYWLVIFLHGAGGAVF